MRQSARNVGCAVGSRIIRSGAQPVRHGGYAHCAISDDAAAGFPGTADAPKNSVPLAFPNVLAEFTAVPMNYRLTAPAVIADGCTASSPQYR